MPFLTLTNLLIEEDGLTSGRLHEFAISHVVTPLVLDSYNAGPDMSMANAAVGLTRRFTGSPSEFPRGTPSQMLKSPFKMQSSRIAKSAASTCKACVRWFASKAMHYSCTTKDSILPFLGFLRHFYVLLSMRSPASCIRNC